MSVFCDGECGEAGGEEGERMGEVSGEKMQGGEGGRKRVQRVIEIIFESENSERGRELVERVIKMGRKR